MANEDNNKNTGCENAACIYFDVKKKEGYRKEKNVCLDVIGGKDYVKQFLRSLRQVWSNITNYIHQCQVRFGQDFMPRNEEGQVSVCFNYYSHFCLLTFLTPLHFSNLF